MTTVTGILRDAQQNAIPNAGVTVRYTRALVGFDGGAVGQNDRLFTTDGSGLLTMTDLIPGHYEVSVFMPTNANTTETVIKRGTGLVPIGIEELTLELFLDANAEPITPSLVQQAFAARDAAQAASASAGSAVDLAQAWAESPTPPDPNDPDSKSSKTWAQESEGSSIQSSNFASESRDYRDQSQLAALAAGAPIVTVLPSPPPAEGTVVLLQTQRGLDVYEVVSGVWGRQGVLWRPLFSESALHPDTLALIEHLADIDVELIFGEDLLAYDRFYRAIQPVKGILDIVYFTAGRTEAHAPINLLSPGDFTLSAQSNTTWTPLDGYRSTSSSNGLIRTFFSPSAVSGANYTLNAASMGVLTTSEEDNDSSQASTADLGIGFSVSFETYLNVGRAGANSGISTRLNNSSGLIWSGNQHPAGVKQGVTVVVRNDSETLTMYKNGSQIGASVSREADTLPDGEFVFLRTSTGNYPMRAIGGGFVGGAMTDEEVAIISGALYNLAASFGVFK